METLIYFFPNKEEYKFEAIHIESDEAYWAKTNGGIELHPIEVVNILNGVTTIDKVLDVHYDKLHSR